MPFPSDPSDGDTYDVYVYDSSLGAWVKNFGTAVTADVTDGATDDTEGRVLRIDDYLERAGESDDA